MPLLVGVAGDVQPVPAPALSVSRRSEQAVDDAFEGLGRVVATRTHRSPRRTGGSPGGRGSPGGGASACRPEAPAASPAASSRARIKPSIGDRGHRASMTGRRFRDSRQSETPRTAVPCSSQPGGTLPAETEPEHRRPWPGCPHLDPGGERIDLRLRELLLGRHRHVAFVADGEDQQALVRLAANDRRAGDPALQQATSSESTRSVALPSPESGPWQR